MDRLAGEEDGRAVGHASGVDQKMSEHLSKDEVGKRSERVRKHDCVAV